MTAQMTAKPTHRIRPFMMIFDQRMIFCSSCCSGSFKFLPCCVILTDCPKTLEKLLRILYPGFACVNRSSGSFQRYGGVVFQRLACLFHRSSGNWVFETALIAPFRVYRHAGRQQLSCSRLPYRASRKFTAFAQYLPLRFGCLCRFSPVDRR